MKLITINLSYYNQSKEIILKHLDYWHSYPQEVKDKLTFFIIDDCSKVPINEILTKDDIKELDVVIYRVKKDLYCNIAGIRNLGAKECKTPWYVIIDMDTLINPKMAKELIKLAKNNMNKNNTFKFNRKVINNPYIKKEKVKGIGEVTSVMQKAGGRLVVKIDVADDVASDIAKKIEYAGVSSFYLGKKGLAYVSDIRV